MTEGGPTEAGPTEPGPAGPGFDLAGLPRLAEVRWSAAITDADTGAVLAGHRPEAVLPTASVGKVFLLAELARQIEAGELDPAERLDWLPDEWLADSGLWYLLDQRPLTVSDLCVLVGAFSDNLATNVLVRRVGIEAVQTAARRLGYVSSSLLDRVRLERTADHPPALSIGSAGELADLMGRLHRGSVTSPAVSGRVLGWLSANADLSMVAAAFDLDPLAHADPDRGVRLVNKTGTVSTVRADIGLVVGVRRAFSYAVLATWPAQLDLRDPVLAAMRQVGQQLRTAVEGRIAGSGAPSDIASSDIASSKIAHSDVAHSDVGQEVVEQAGAPGQ